MDFQLSSTTKIIRFLKTNTKQQKVELQLGLFPVEMPKGIYNSVLPVHKEVAVWS